MKKLFLGFFKHDIFKNLYLVPAPLREKKKTFKQLKQYKQSRPNSK